ncbi:hypothetical protein L227DRAFT_560439 [Lentinus tigrinus ALCF2SS1-6]|uniref:Uncharacterized protein n=1 Tax=Lentinus tigrinus ALCF2SS1-6 TaxID=1328759 RepID=A0A5C2SMP2_9APHY|nr:hypothetical protein L227DRAFT_560439 [Lentinus tigrinus ALCF2SS1-6]
MQVPSQVLGAHTVPMDRADIPAMVVPFFDQHWHAQSSSTLSWSLAVLLVSLAGALWTWSRTTSRAKIGAAAVSRAPACPPELLKDDLQGGVANAYTFEREITVPFDIGDTRVSKILVHPIKSCRGTSVTESRYSPEGLERTCALGRASHPTLQARVPATPDYKWH